MWERMVGIEYVCGPRFNLQGSMGIDCSVDFLPVAKHMRVVDKSTFADIFDKSTVAAWEVAAEMSRVSNAACINHSKQFLAISSNLQ